MFARVVHRRATHKHKTMILPKDPIAVLCDIDDAWELNKELLQAGVPCLFEDEQRFRASYKGTNDIGLVWGSMRAINPLMIFNAHLAVPMPEFRAAFGLNPKPQL